MGFAEGGTTLFLGYWKTSLRNSYFLKSEHRQGVFLISRMSSNRALHWSSLQPRVKQVKINFLPLSIFPFYFAITLAGMLNWVIWVSVFFSLITKRTTVPSLCRFNICASGGSRPGGKVGARSQTFGFCPFTVVFWWLRSKNKEGGGSPWSATVCKEIFHVWATNSLSSFPSNTIYWSLLKNL